MTVAPHSGIIDFGTFTPPTGSKDGIQGEVPAPLIAEVTYVLSATGWVPMSGGGSGTVTSVAASGGTTGLTFSGSPITTSGTLTLGGTLAVVSGGTGRAVGNYSVYANEIHVSNLSGNDTTGDGTLINPVATVTKALTLLTATARTVIMHPGVYAESPTVSAANTTITTLELTGANTHLTGTLTLSAAARISGLKMSNLTITGSGSTYISNCTVDTQVIKSGSNYVEIINSELQCVSGVQITGAGVVSIVGNKCWAVAVSNAGANVIVKDCFQVLTPSVTAGSLSFDGCVIVAAAPASNAITTSAGSFITLANSFALNSAGTSVERVSLAGFYSILNFVYDKPNSTFAGTNLNAIDYFSVINADTLVLTNDLTVANGGTGASTLSANAVLYGNGTSAIAETAVGATGQVLVGNTAAAPSWSALSSNAVTSFSAGTTGLTPSTGTTGSITLSGTLAVANGGTGVTTSTGSGSNVLSQSPTITGTTTLGGTTYSAPAWSTTGVGIRQPATTYTDNSTPAGNSVTTAYMNLFGTATYDSSLGSPGNEVQVVNLYGNYFKAPASTTNIQTINSYAVGIDTLYVTGTSKFDGNIGTITAAGITCTNITTNVSGSASSFAGPVTITAGSGLVLTAAANAFTLTTTGSGQINIGGTGATQTGAMQIGRTTGSQNIFIANGVTSTGNTAQVSIGINGASGSSTLITIGGTANVTTTTMNGTVSCTGSLETTGTANAVLNGTGVITIGATAATNTITIGRSTVSQTTNIQAGVTASGSTKTINLGTSGAAGSTTNITVGSTTGTSTTTMQGNTATPAGTTAMTNGFFYIPAAAGAPSGTPTAITGTVPMYYDTTNNRFYIYNGAWKLVALV